MSISFPKPRKPATELVIYSPLAPGTWENRSFGTSGSYDPGISEVSIGRRNYASGYPLLPIGPNQFFKRVTDYHIFGLRATSKFGTLTRRYKPEYAGDDRISYIETGPPTWNFPQWGDGVSPHFSGAQADIGIPTNIRFKLGTQVMLKVGSKKASFGEAIAESRQTIVCLQTQRYVYFVHISSLNAGVGAESRRR